MIQNNYLTVRYLSIIISVVNELIRVILGLFEKSNA